MVLFIFHSKDLNNDMINQITVEIINYLSRLVEHSNNLDRKNYFETNGFQLFFYVIK
jgi:hypothetical protein